MSARYVNEAGILLHDTWRRLPVPDLRPIDAPELKRIPEPVVIEHPPFLLHEVTGDRADPDAMHAQGDAVDLLLILAAWMALAAAVLCCIAAVLA